MQTHACASDEARAAISLLFCVHVRHFSVAYGDVLFRPNKQRRCINTLSPVHRSKRRSHNRVYGDYFYMKSNIRSNKNTVPSRAPVRSMSIISCVRYCRVDGNASDGSTSP